jgi:hypothetical protein
VDDVASNVCVGPTGGRRLMDPSTDAPILCSGRTPVIRAGSLYLCSLG